jgi:hypothetical protein
MAMRQLRPPYTLRPGPHQYALPPLQAQGFLEENHGTGTAGLCKAVHYVKRMDAGKSGKVCTAQPVQL